MTFTIYATQALSNMLFLKSQLTGLVINLKQGIRTFLGLESTDMTKKWKLLIHTEHENHPTKRLQTVFLLVEISILPACLQE